MEGANSRIFAPPAARAKGREAALVSALVHLLIFALFAAGLLDWLSRPVEAPPEGGGDLTVRFVATGGGSEALGALEDAGAAEDLPAAPEPVAPVSEQETTPPTPVAPRIPRPLSFEEIVVPDVRIETPRAFGAGAPDAPALPQIESRALGGLGPRAAATGPRGPSGASRGGRLHARGDYDVDPVPIYEPPDPPYPKAARDRMISGEVILEVLVKLDGSTEVVGVIKSLPHCVEAAIESARQWRWKPAQKDGRPVEAYGIITITFDLFSARSGK